MGCFLIDRNQPMSNNYKLMFEQVNKPIFTNDIEERERIFDMGGIVKYDQDYRIYASG